MCIILRKEKLKKYRKSFLVDVNVLLLCVRGAEDGEAVFSEFYHICTACWPVVAARYMVE